MSSIAKYSPFTICNGCEYHINSEHLQNHKLEYEEKPKNIKNKRICGISKKLQFIMAEPTAFRLP